MFPQKLKRQSLRCFSRLELRTSGETNHPDIQELLVRHPPLEVLAPVVSTARATRDGDLLQQWRRSALLLRHGGPNESLTSPHPSQCSHQQLGALLKNQRRKRRRPANAQCGPLASWARPRRELNRECRIQISHGHPGAVARTTGPPPTRRAPNRKNGKDDSSPLSRIGL